MMSMMMIMMMINVIGDDDDDDDDDDIGLRLVFSVYKLHFTRYSLWL